MRPLALAERTPTAPTVSLRALLSGARGQHTGATEWVLADYAREIAASGLPGLRGLPKRPLQAQLEGYLRRIVDRDRGVGAPPAQSDGSAALDEAALLGP